MIYSAISKRTAVILEESIYCIYLFKNNILALYAKQYKINGVLQSPDMQLAGCGFAVVHITGAVHISFGYILMLTGMDL